MIDATNSVPQNTKASYATTNNESAKAKQSSNDSLSINDFFMLLAAQLQNQDMMNPVQDTEFLAQLAQFTTLETMNQLLETQTAAMDLNNTNYAASLLGKDVTVARAVKDEEGNTKLETHSGVVSGVSFFEGAPLVYVNDKPYHLQEIMAVGTLPTKPGDQGSGGEGEGNGETDNAGGGGGTEASGNAGNGSDGTTDNTQGSGGSGGDSTTESAAKDV